MSEIARSEQSLGELGRDVGAVGRWFRLIAGGGLSAYVLYHAAHATSAAEVMELALYFIAALSAYMAAEFLLGERVFAKIGAWPRTAILLGPLGVVFAFELGPHVFHHALLLYIGVSLIFSFFLRYGGCEVMSIPSLIFGTRHTVYCPLNVVDAVEKAVTDREPKAAGRAEPK
jgi:hypothetical protein